MTTPTLIVSHAPVKIGFSRKQCKHLKGEFLTMYKYPRIQGDDPSKVSIWTYMFNLSISERWLLTEILNEHSYKSNMAKVIPNNEVQKNYVKHGYKKLFEDGWVARTKRGHYMLNPVIKEVPAELMVDAILLWNTHCHDDAVIRMPTQYQLTTFDMDTAHLLNLIKQAEFTTLADTTLLSIIAYMRTAKWLDANDEFTDRKPSTAKHAQHIVDECKTRGLI